MVPRYRRRAAPVPLHGDGGGRRPIPPLSPSTPLPPRNSSAAAAPSLPSTPLIQPPPSRALSSRCPARSLWNRLSPSMSVRRRREALQFGRRRRTAARFGRRREGKKPDDEKLKQVVKVNSRDTVVQGNTISAPSIEGTILCILVEEDCGAGSSVIKLFNLLHLLSLEGLLLALFGRVWWLGQVYPHYAKVHAIFTPFLSALIRSLINLEY
ncbi:hypothetical protein ACQ4PT_006718 [Festuca glaucescens]